MSTDKFDFAEILAVLEAKHAALGSTIEHFRAALKLGALGSGDNTVAGPSQQRSGFGADRSIELPNGALVGKTIPDAIRIFLSAARRKQTTEQIVEALREGGVESTAKNFKKSVNTTLNRLTAFRELLKFKDGWALAEFYPESLRAKIEAAADARPKKRPKKAKAAKKPLLALPPVAPSETSKAERIVRFLKAHEGQAYSAAAIASAIGQSPVGFGIVLMHLANGGQIVKTDDGLYRLR
jgi:hypothetical protein